ncbi:hypothetical protein ACEZCY_12480 [Streptacidiphilus sp. N1-12]|uniref:Uncharacterized protein n=2 Tax=Streptacidiphilus alkalitolerans TaxID=3342712 RepID=A0ABV6WDD7_9ACTN
MVEEGEHVDHLANIALVLGEYEEWTFADLTAFLTGAGAEPRKSGVMVVDRARLLEAIAARANWAGVAGGTGVSSLRAFSTSDGLRYKAATSASRCSTAELEPVSKAAREKEIAAAALETASPAAFMSALTTLGSICGMGPHFGHQQYRSSPGPRAPIFAPAARGTPIAPGD